jgi:hypothetical protein
MPTKPKKARTIDERLDQLTAVVETLAGTVVAHDNQLDALIRIAEQHAQSIANLEKQWQAYINTLPRN